MSSYNRWKEPATIITAFLATILIVASLAVILPIQHGPEPPEPIEYQYAPPGQLERFTSLEHLLDYMRTHKPESTITYGPEQWGQFDALIASLSTGSGDYPEHSDTNVQVEGVDEPDCVKTDGQYIYTISYNEIVVLRAYPPQDAGIVSRIQPEGIPHSIFFYDSRRLVVLSSDNDYGYSNQTIQVFDVTDPASAILTYTITLDAVYVGARLIANHLYYTAYTCSIDDDEFLVLPTVNINGHMYYVAPTDIYYDSGVYEYHYFYNMVLGLDIEDPNALPNVETLLTGEQGTDTYTSTTHTYIAMGHYPWQSRWADRYTAIHRFAITEGEIEYEASGSVPGYTINQFAFDQQGNTFRVATTNWANVTDSSYPGGWDWIQVNNVYVLDRNMGIIGAIEGLAPTEWIYSVRFMGDTAYLVTFNKIDPLFVIDLTNPFAPELLGELEIPGYSDYLHPLGNDQILGLGKNVTVSESGEFWWYQGVKFTIFNASDPYNPQETLRMVIGVRGTTSPALYDHHAILVDTDRNLLVLPMLIYEYTDGLSEHPPYESGDRVWQGAMVFYLDASTSTLTSVLNITHTESADDLDYYYFSWRNFRFPNPRFISRTLYIGNILYTISLTKLMMHDLDTYSSLGGLTFSTEPIPPE
jgi:uncharacterized secreted protein with C-terminal beta-propeller domain